MSKILTALALAALMIGNGVANAAGLISENVSQGVFFTLLGLSIFVITNNRRRCAPCPGARMGDKT